MGSKKITIQNLEVVRVDVENNLLLIKGAVPGPKKSLVTIKEAVKIYLRFGTRKGGTYRWQKYLFTIWKAKKLIQSN